MTMIRKQIYLQPEQDSLLKLLVQETGQSEAELIRLAIDRQLRIVPNVHRDLKAWERERAFVQRLIEQGAAPMPRQWTRDELYER